MSERVHNFDALFGGRYGGGIVCAASAHGKPRDSIV